VHQVLRANNWKLLRAVMNYAAEILGTGEQQQQEVQLSAAAAAAGDNSTAGASGNAVTAGDAKASVVEKRVGRGTQAWGQMTAADAAGGRTLETAATAVAALVAAAGAAGGSSNQQATDQQHQQIPDDDAIWMAVWLRKKELLALQAAAAAAAKSAGSPIAVAAGAGSAVQGGAAGTGCVDGSGRIGGAAVMPGPAHVASGPDGNNVDAPPAVGTEDAKQHAAAAAATVQPTVHGAVVTDELNGTTQPGVSHERADGSAAAAAAAAAAGPTPAIPQPGKPPPKVLADLVESLVAAVFVDSGGGWDEAWRVVEHFLYKDRGSQQQQQQGTTS
jgi:hypothetical protein